MSTYSTDIILHNKVFALIALGTMFILTVPLALMMFRIPLLDPGSGYEVINWSPGDFLAMAILIFGTGSVFVVIARKVNRKNRIAVAIACILGFLWLWAELAVGIFTNWGS